MAACNIFDEDEVCMLTEKGCIYGLVLENSEYASTDEEQNDPDPFCDCVRRGTARVAWHPDGKECVVPECKLILADRSLMPGDCVRRLIQGEDSQRGYVQDMTVECCLQVMGTKKFIDGINSKDLLQIREWSPEPGDVVLDSWVGRLDVVNVIVTLRFPDGAKCEIHDVDIISFEDLNEKRGKHTEFVNRFYYPGQQLRGVMGDLRDVEWIHSTQLYNKTNANSKQRMNMNVVVVVEEVKTKDVEVHWSCCGFKNASSTEAPPSIVKKDDLLRMKKLDWFHHSSIQIGDKAYYIIKDTDVIFDHQPKHHTPQNVPNGGRSCSGLTNGFTDARNGSKATGGHMEVEGADSCINGTEMVTGKDQDDDEKPEKSLSKITNIDEIENLEEYEELDDDDESDKASATSGHSNASTSSLQRKKPTHRGPTLKTQLMKKVRGRKARQKMTLPERDLKPGEKVPVEVCYTFSRVNVMWQDGSVELGIPSPDLFPIHHLDELEFFPGDYVLDAKDSGASNVYGVVISCNHAERTCLVKWMRAYDAGKSNRPEIISPSSEVSVYDIKDHPYYKFRPGHAVIRVGGADETSSEPVEAAGQVYQLDPQGFIMVKWPSSRVTCCYPQELFVVGDEMSDLSEEEDEEEEEEEEEEEDGNSDWSWETETEEEVDPDTLEPKSPLPKTIFEQSSRTGTYDDRKDHLDYLIQRANSALSRLDSMVKSNDPNYPLDLLRIFHNCQSLDKFLKLSHFDDPDMNYLVWIIESEVSRLKSDGGGGGSKAVDNPKQPHDSSSGNLLTSENNEETPPPPPPPSPKMTDCEDGCSSSNQMDSTSSSENHVNNTNKERYCIYKCNEARLKLSTSQSAMLLCQSDKGDDLTIADSKMLSKSMEFCSSLKNKTPIWMQLPSSRVNDSSQENVEWGKSMKELCFRLIKLLQDRIGRMPKEVNKKWRKRILEATRNIPFCDDSYKDKGVQTESSQVEETDALPGHSWFALSAGPTEHKAVQTSLADEAIAAAGAATALTADNPDEASGASKEGKSEADEVSKLDNSLPLDAQEECSVDEFDPAARNTNGFQVIDETPNSHHYLTHTHLSSQKNFLMSLRRESKLLKTSLPDGIFVKEFEERMDLFSVMIVGPAKTPYEDGLFIFDVQLPNDYPSSPPRFHYVSYCTDRLNPNLYEDGKVCVSLLGTWSGKGNEMWTQESNLLQVLVSIQGLILVGEPYYNEAGYEKQRGTQQGIENSRMYNEMAIVKLVQAMTNMARKLPPVFMQEVQEHLLLNGPKMITRLRKWLELSDKVSVLDGGSLPTQLEKISSEKQESASTEDCDVPPAQQHETSQQEEDMMATTSSSEIFYSCSASSLYLNADSNSSAYPDFPLLPASRGFCLSLKKHLELFQNVLETLEKKVQ